MQSQKSLQALIKAGPLDEPPSYRGLLDAPASESDRKHPRQPQLHQQHQQPFKMNGLKLPPKPPRSPHAQAAKPKGRAQPQANGKAKPKQQAKPKGKVNGKQPAKGKGSGARSRSPESPGLASHDITLGSVATVMTADHEHTLASVSFNAAPSDHEQPHEHLEHTAASQSVISAAGASKSQLDFEDCSVSPHALEDTSRSRKSGMPAGLDTLGTGMISLS